MAEPSIKGSVFRGVVEDLVRLRDEGRVPEDEIQAQLTERDLRILDQKILDGSWYPIETYARMVELLCRTVGGGRTDYYLERGAASAKRLLASGLYSQLEFLQRWRETPEGGESAERMIAAYSAKLKLVISLAGAIYNVGRWSVGPDPRDAAKVRIDILEADAYSDGMRYAIEGFLNECTRAVRSDVPRLFRTERTAPDHIAIEMTLPVQQLLASSARG